jgi:hypothetical protein
MRTIRCILAEERQWSSLIWADAICMALGLRLDDELVVIPGSRSYASKKMATDELEVAFEFGKLDKITTEDIDRRAAELETLRDEILGTPTQAQVDRASRDCQRQKEKNRR